MYFQFSIFFSNVKYVLKLFLARKDKCMNVSVTNDTKDIHRCGFYVCGCVDLSVVGEARLKLTMAKVGVFC